MGLFTKSFSPYNLSQRDSVVVPAKKAARKEHVAPSSKLSEEERNAINYGRSGTTDVIDDICYYLYHQAAAKTGKDHDDFTKWIRQILDENNDISGNVMEYIIEYCDGGIPQVVRMLYDERKKNNKLNFNLKVPSASPPPDVLAPVPIQPLPRPPAQPLPQPPAQPLPELPWTPTPGGISRPGTSPTLPTTPMREVARLPTYMDVAPKSTPQYGTDLQRQLDSYSQKLQEYYQRPSVPTQSAGRDTGTPVPGTPVATPGGPGRCPPGQFWDGRQCRGSIAPGAAGLISAAGGMGPSGASMAPGGFSPGGVTPTSYQIGTRYPVVNI